jgi:hypothetical protein
LVETNSEALLRAYEAGLTGVRRSDPTGKK